MENNDYVLLMSGDLHHKKGGVKLKPPRKWHLMMVTTMTNGAEKDVMISFVLKGRKN